MYAAESEFMLASARVFLLPFIYFLVRGFVPVSREATDLPLLRSFLILPLLREPGLHWRIRVFFWGGGGTNGIARQSDWVGASSG